MSTLVTQAAVGVAGAACVLVTEQYWHYYQSRRKDLNDQQPLLHSTTAVHCIVLVSVKDQNSDLRGALDGIRAAVEAAGGLVVYEGQGRFPKVNNSSQLGQFFPGGFDGCSIIQCDSVQRLAELRASGPYAAALARCADAYHVAFKRSREVSLVLPMLMLAQRLRSLFTGRRYLPFKKATPEEMQAGLGSSVDGRGSKSRQATGMPLGDPSRMHEPTVVINLDRTGPKAAREANDEYEANVMPIFAEMRNGPIHMGKATDWDGKAEGVKWDSVAVVHYPTWELFTGMINGAAWNRISGNKQLGDHLAIPTNPLPRARL